MRCRPIPPPGITSDELLQQFRDMPSGPEPFRTPDTLIDLYVRQEMSITRVARHLGVSTKCVSDTLNYYQIPKRQHADVAGRRAP